MNYRIAKLCSKIGRVNKPIVPDIRQCSLERAGRGQAVARHRREVPPSCRERGRRGSRGHERTYQVSCYKTIFIIITVVIELVASN